MKKTFTILIAAIAAILMMTQPEKVMGETTYQEVLTFDCAYASENGTQDSYGVTSTSAMADAGIDAFLETAASTTNKISVSNVSGSVYWRKGSGGDAVANIPDYVLKVGKASGAGAFTFTIDNSYDAIDRIVITGYPWKNTSSISVNSLDNQSGSVATETDFTFDFNSSTRSFAISVSTSAVCVTEIKLYKKVTITQTISVDSPMSLDYNETYKEATLTTNIASPSFTVSYFESDGTTPATYSWITNAGVYQSNGYNFYCTVEANSNTSSRTAYLKVLSGTTSSNLVTVTQAAAPAPDYYVNLSKNSVNVDYTQHADLQDIDVTTNLTVEDAGDFVVYFYANATDEDDNPLENAPSWIPSATVVYNSTAEKYQVKYTINSCPSNVSSSRVAYFRVYAADDNNEAYSETVTVTQTPMPQAAAPQFAPVAGAVTIGTTVELSCETANSTIYYTINGGDITEYEDAITINTATTIQAFASADGYRDSETATAEYTIVKVAAPTFTPAAGEVLPGTKITLSCETEGAAIQYSTNNGDSWNDYSAPIAINTGTTFKAKATKTNYTPSDENSAIYTIATVHNVDWALTHSGENGVYVEGIISQIEEVSTGYKNATYYISADGLTTSDQFYIYHGRYLNNTDFTATDQIAVGDAVIVYGNITTWSSTIEMAANNYLVSLVRVPSITADNANLAANATSGEISYTLNNPVAGGSLSISQTGDWFTATLVAAENKVTLSTTANTGDERTGSVTITYTYNTNETVSKEVTVKQDSPSTWELTSFEDLTPADVFVIVCNKTISNELKHFAMSNDKGTSNPPDAVEVSVGESSLSNAPESKLQWNVVITDEGYVFYPAGETDKWLYYRDNNNALRVGGSKADNSSNKHFVMDDTFNYLKTVDLTTARYFGVYNSQDWRGYNLSNDAIANNIKDQTFSFYRKVTGPVSPTLGIDGCGANAGGYYLIASPVASVTPTSGNGFICTDEGNNYDLYSFDQSQNGAEWRNYKAKSFNIESGKGYLYASKNGTTLYFTGQQYNGNGIVALSYTAEKTLSGWNLIGNPYNTTAYLADSRDFYRMNAAGTGIFVATDDAIALMEGIFVQAADAADESVTFTTTNPNAKSIDARIVLNVVGNNDNVIDRAIVRFNDRKSLSKLLLHEDNTNIYIPQDSKKFAIVQSNGKADMPVNFKAAEMGKYTISVNTEGINMDYLHLIDRLTGEDVNLLLDNSYSFVASAQDVESRFILSFTATGYNTDADEPFAYQNGSEIIVSGEGELQIFDVTGRSVMTTTINGVESVNVSAQGVLILRLVGTEVKTQKMVVR